MSGSRFKKNQSGTLPSASAIIGNINEGKINVWLQMQYQRKVSNPTIQMDVASQIISFVFNVHFTVVFQLPDRDQLTKTFIMWIGSIRLVVQTKDSSNAGTDSLVQVTVLRNGVALRVLNLDYPAENDLERGDIRSYDYIGPTKLPRRNDETEELPPGIGQNPMPYPGYGFEFSHGLSGHLVLRLRIRGSDMWIKDKVDLYVRYIREQATSFDTLAWVEDSGWTYISSWNQDVPMSKDSDEGVTTWNLNLT